MAEEPRPQSTAATVQAQTAQGKSNTSKTTALILCIVLSWLGVHRFYVGKVGTGILLLLTIGGCGIWWIINIIQIATGEFTDKQGRALAQGARPEPRAC
ncbi:MAG: TM2 domain-containing protein [candidate division WOR-3 bacterium]|nr:MAG: TM2 domain-containing protein [candidate division WOR-3 bacterium]